MTHHQRLRKEYGSIKAALEYCRDFPMNYRQTAEHLGVDRKFLDVWATRLNIKFGGFELRRTHNVSEAVAESNRRRKGIPVFSKMKPREINGIVYYPGEPTFHFLLAQGRK